jgi:LytTr DNA-binding domain
VIFDAKALHTVTPPPSRFSFYRQSVLIGIGIFAVLAVFQPFGTYLFEHQLKYLLLAGYGLLVPLTAVLLLEAIAIFWRAFFDPKRWTFRRELLLSGCFLLLTVVLSYFYHHLVIGGPFSLNNFLGFLLIGLATALLPMALMLLWRFFEVKSQIVALEFAEKLAQSAEHPSVGQAQFVGLEGDNKHEKLTFLRAEILYLQAADNYVEIFLKKNGATQRLMLRGALSNMAQQLEPKGMFRQVHRSFVVNFEHAIRLEGKSPAYYLVFEQAPDASEIPVSRQAIGEVRAMLAAKPR